MIRALRKKYRGAIAVEIAISPLAMLGIVVAVLALVMVIYFSLCALFFNIVIIQGSREASVNPNVTEVRNLIYETTKKVLPDAAAGITLISVSDIDINPSDGDHVTTKATYKVMLPGLRIYQKFGGSAASWIIPVKAKFSFLREY